MALYAELRCSQYVTEDAPKEMKHEHYLYTKAYNAVQLAMLYGELYPRERSIEARWGGALMLYIPMKHLQADSPDPRRTTIQVLQTFLHRGGGVETFTLGYDTVGFWTFTEAQWQLSTTAYDLFGGLGLYPATFSVRPQ